MGRHIAWSPMNCTGKNKAFRTLGLSFLSKTTVKAEDGTEHSNLQLDRKNPSKGPTLFQQELVFEVSGRGDWRLLSRMQILMAL